MPFTDTEQEVAALKDRAEYYEDVLHHIRSRIGELETSREEPDGDTSGGA
jgi:prefoldin subunit 5